MTCLTPGRATQDALEALKAAGVSGRVTSYREQWKIQGRDYIRTGAVVRRADQDATVRALIVLPGTEVYSDQAKTQVVIWRRRADR